MQILAAEPSDYSYFNTNLLRTWAGPEHWKLKPKSKGIANQVDFEKANVSNFEHEDCRCWAQLMKNMQ